MISRRARRGFLADVGRGTLLATLGPALLTDLGLAPKAFAEDLESRLHFGELEPLVNELQNLPIERLQPVLAEKLKSGTALKTLVAAGALANARTFGGEDYIGFHTFMALAPALKMSSMMPAGQEALPIFKVLYRNGSRMQEFGGRESETLQGLSDATFVSQPTANGLREAVVAKDMARAEQLLAEMMSGNPVSGLDALIPLVQDNPEVHRTVLPYRAWDMQTIVGTEHATTLLRQSLRYCVRAEPHRRAEWDEHGKMLVSLIDEYKLNGATPGNRAAEDAFVSQLSESFATAAPMDSARAAASALAEGFSPDAVGEALSLAASQLVLRDGGRLPQWEDRLKPAGSVHGDSVGVHASDAANAWRNLSRISTGQNVFACLIIGAWQVARDRDNPGNLMKEPLPVKHHLDRLASLDGDAVLSRLDEAVRNNLQGNACAAVHRCGELGVSPDRIFNSLLQYAVSEDGALHAEKYFNTVWDDFHATRSALRWRHLVSLARVTASEFGRAAAGQAEARELLKVS